MHEAITDNDFDRIHWLLNNGTKITPGLLLTVIQSKNIEIIKIFLNYVAEPHLEMNRVLERKSDAICQLLIAYGADPVLTYNFHQREILEQAFLIPEIARHFNSDPRFTKLVDFYIENKLQ